MMAARMGLNPAAIPDNPLSLSWHDSTWIPILNTANVMDYFSERSNPFFDRTCNNEIIKMQRLNPDQLQNMTGLEYILLHVQEPILHVIRKQHRYSPTQVTPLADYYIIAGVVYQAPDLASVLNSRLLSCVHHLQQSFDEVAGYSRYHPSRGYTWDFKPPAAAVAQPALPGRPGAAAAAAAAAAVAAAAAAANSSGSGGGDSSKGKGKDEKVAKEEPSSMFQRQRVDMLLGELIKKFPLPNQMPSLSAAASTSITTTSSSTASATKVTNPSNPITASGTNSTSASTTPLVTIKTEPGTTISSVENGNSGTPDIKDAIKTEIKQEKIKPPPEKKSRLN